MSLWIHLNVLESSDLRDRRILQDRVDSVNIALEGAGLPPYIYPSAQDFTHVELPEMNGSSSDLSRLKHAAAMLMHASSWETDEDFFRIYGIKYNIPSDLRRQILSANKSHLLCNHYGIYVPIRFGDNLGDISLQEMGSSINLVEELELLAALLKLKLPDSIYNVKQLDSFLSDLIDFDTGDPLLDVKISAVVLYNVALASVEYNLIICRD
jgi:hypothetical protein